MKTLNKLNAATMDTMVDGLAHPAGAGLSVRKVDNFPGAYMAVVVERIGGARYSVGHYFTQNGDRMSDPEIEFIRLGGAWVPVAITQSPVGRYDRPVECDDSDAPTSIRPRAQADLAGFANLLIKNIRQQQGIRPGQVLPIAPVVAPEQSTVEQA